MRTTPLYSFVPRKSQNAKLLFPASQNFPTGLNTRTVYTQLNFNLYSNSIPLETLITCSITRKHRFTFERGCCYSIGPLPYPRLFCFAAEEMPFLMCTRRKQKGFDLNSYQNRDAKRFECSSAKRDFSS